MPLFRWVRDLGRPRLPGAYEVRDTIVRVTERDISVAEATLRTDEAADAVFVASTQGEFLGGYHLGSIVFTIPTSAAKPSTDVTIPVFDDAASYEDRHA